VVQEAFIRLFKAWSPGLAAADYIRRWLYRVTHNLAVDYIRRESRLRVLHQQHATEVQDARGAGPNADLAREEAMETALYHLRRLKPEERQVVILRLQEGLSYREISAIIGKTETNVGFILHQAVKKIAAGRTRPGAPGKEAAP
jgi:RNA polymerase sigma-70 factor (ECF subfamily)